MHNNNKHRVNLVSNKKKLKNKTKRKIKGKIRSKSKLYNRKKRGGAKIGYGTYGCVVKPHIKCFIEPNNNKKDIVRDLVSKIVNDEDDELAKTELKIYKAIKKIDPKNKYFITFNNICYLKKNYILDRNDINVVNDTKTKRLNYNAKHNSNESNCAVDFTKKPINIIMMDGGSDLFDIMLNKKNLFTDVIYLLYSDLKNILTHLLEGIKLLHENHMVHLDIKPKNIMLKTVDDISLNARYIDYGFTVNLKDILKRKRDLKGNGTPGYKSVELLLFKEIFRRKREQMKDTYNKKDKNKVPHNLVVQCFNKLKDLLYKKRVSINLKVDKKDSDELMKIINNLYSLPSYDYIIDKFSNIRSLNSYLCKTDIYALGITFSDLRYHLLLNKVINNYDELGLLNDLIDNMIQLNPDKRYNIIQCLQHPYITN